MSNPSPSPDAGAMNFDGFGQVMDPMEFVKRAWSTFNLPTPFTPTLNVEELDKRITDLRAVEQWLSLNQNMLRNTIQGLEIQRGTINAVKNLSDSFGKAIKPADDAMAQALASFATTAAPNAPAPSSDPMPAAAPDPQTAATPDPLQAASINPLAWWDLLQSNFQQIAQAASAGAQAPTDAPPSPAGRKRAAGPKVAKAARAGAKPQGSKTRTAREQK